MTVPMAADVRSSTVAVPATSTTSSRRPISSLTFSSRVCPISSVTSSCRALLNPLSSAVTTYEPAGRKLKTYTPAALVIASRLRPVDGDSNLTVTPGMTAPP
jgi:hypothetical protein